MPEGFYQPCIGDGKPSFGVSVPKDYSAWILFGANTSGSSRRYTDRPKGRLWCPQAADKAAKAGLPLEGGGTPKA